MFPPPPNPPLRWFNLNAHPEYIKALEKQVSLKNKTKLIDFSADQSELP